MHIQATSDTRYPDKAGIWTTVLWLVLSYLLLSSGSVLAETSPAQPVTEKTQQSAVTQTISINSATVNQLTLLKGIGVKKAERIVQYRTEHGPFKTLEAITAVKGVSLRIINQNREELTL